MTKTIVLSERKTKAAAALAQMTLEEINKAAGLGVGYISRKWGSDGVTLATINRVANIIDCSALDLLEEIDPPEPEPQAKPDPAAAARQAKRDGLRVQKIADNEYYIVDHDGKRLTTSFASNEDAAPAMITNPPKPKPTSDFSDACTQRGKIKARRVSRRRDRSMSIMEAL